MLKENASLGILMTLVAYLLFALLDTAVKWMLPLGIPALQLAFLRYAGHFAVSLADAGQNWKGNDLFPRRHLFTLTLRGSLLVVATVGNFVALKFLPLTITSAIMFSAPIIVCFLAGPMLGEKVGIWRWSAIMLGFAGVLVIIQPFGEKFQWVALISVFNAFCMALYSILTRRLAGQVTARTMQFYTGALGTLVLAPVAIVVWVPSSDPLVLFLWAWIGFAGWLGHEVLTRAHAHAPASTLMPFTYSFLIYLIVFSYLIFDHLPQRHTLLGAGIIVVAGIVIWKREQIRTAVVQDVNTK